MSRGLLLSLSIFALLAPPLAANEYKSPLGFVGSVPNGWVVLTAQLRDEPSLFSRIFGDLQKRDPRSAEALRNRIMSGEQDVIFRVEPAEVSFRDNINVLSRPGRLPKTLAEADTVCQALKGNLGSPGEQGTLKTCEARALGLGQDFSLFLEQGGTSPGTTVLQYQVPCSPGYILGVTAVVKIESLSQARKDLDQFVTSIRCNS